MTRDARIAGHARKDKSGWLRLAFIRRCGMSECTIREIAGYVVITIMTVAALLSMRR